MADGPATLKETLMRFSQGKCLNAWPESVPYMPRGSWCTKIYKGEVTETGKTGGAFADARV